MRAPAAARSLIEYRAIIERNIVPALGSMQVAALTRADVTKLHADISKRAPVQANRTLAVLRHMLNLAATEWGMREGANPASAFGAIPNIRGTVISSRMSWDGCSQRSDRRKQSAVRQHHPSCPANGGQAGRAAGGDLGPVQPRRRRLEQASEPDQAGQAAHHPFERSGAAATGGDA